MDFFVQFTFDTEDYHQDYRPLEDGKILQYATDLHSTMRMDRWAIYPNMNRYGKSIDKVYAIHQNSREDVIRQHRAELKVCLLGGIKQYVSIFYTDVNVSARYTENMVVAYYDYIENSETLFIIPIKGNKLKLNRMEKTYKTTDFSPCNITGREIEEYGSFKAASDFWSDMINQAM